MEFLKSLAVPTIVVGILAVVVAVFDNLPPMKEEAGNYKTPHEAIAAKFKRS